MGRVKYSPEMRAQTVKYILEGGKSASKAAVELGIDKNTVCRWVREYREAHRMPTYEV
ncbi:MAG: transposase [Clostridia bacterium]|nr:transposase [Clostridia bacterium]